MNFGTSTQWQHLAQQQNHHRSGRIEMSLGVKQAHDGALVPGYEGLLWQMFRLSNPVWDCSSVARENWNCFQCSLHEVL